MNFELIQAVVDELSTTMTNAKISKIYQPNADVIILKLRVPQQSLSLLLSSEPNKSRIHLTQQQWLNPSRPPRFCQLLRSRISRIESLEIVDKDRIVQFCCSGPQEPTRLILELTGRFSNMILLNEQDVIIDLLKRIEGDGSHRTLLPGLVYRFPEKTVRQTQMEETVEVIERGDLTWSQYVEKLYNKGQQSENKQDLVVSLQKTLEKQIKKLKKRVKNITAEYEKQQNYQLHKLHGELILAHLHQISKGMTAIEVDNYFDPASGRVEIALDPLLNPHGNAENYFKRYKKAKRGLEHSQRRLNETQAELDWYEQLEYQLNDSVKNSDIEEIAQELRAVDVLKDKNRLHDRRTQQPSSPYEITSPSGLKIIWGRNNRQNDEISTRLLKKGDLWFHAHKAPGCHLILKAEGRKRDIIDEDIVCAASMAAGYSKKKHDAKVEVIVAEAQDVHKPKGAKAGLVTVRQYQTVLVQPKRIDS